uniref:HAT C-terminal dimerisation domain-containing protein n=1 Tax=Nothobranchius korthausae TaxID=1143690 RepID=A0A1A8F484_9TELE
MFSMFTTVNVLCGAYNTGLLLISIARLNISMDELYDECVAATSLLEHLTKGPQEKEKWQSKRTSEKWMEILQAADLPNIQPVVSFVLSIPSSTGFAERIFSLMKNKWTDVRNKCSTELIRCELIVTLNYDMSCSEFYSAVLKDKQLLNAARSQKKYKWRK